MVNFVTLVDIGNLGETQGMQADNLCVKFNNILCNIKDFVVTKVEELICSIRPI